MDSTPPQSEQQRILAIETSTVACSVAIQIAGPKDTRTDSIEQEVPRSHNRALLGMVHELLVRNQTSVSQLSAIFFGCGPGSFTGTRIAAAVTQGLALPFATQIFAVSSLHALAAGNYSLHPNCCGVISFIRSRPGEYYRGIYAVKNGELNAVGAEDICPTNALYPDSYTLNSALKPGGEKQSGPGAWLAIFDETPLPQPDLVKSHASAPTYADNRISTVLVTRPFAQGLLAVPGEARRLVSTAEAVPVYVQGSKPWKKQTA